MHFDIPSRSDIEFLAAARRDVAVSIYLPTSPIPAQAEENRLRARSLIDEAVQHLHDLEDKKVAKDMEGRLQDLLDDPDFWTNLGRSLAIFVSSEGIAEFRLPNELSKSVSVSDKFAVTPLLRALTFPQAAFVLAISGNGARLVKATSESPAEVVDVPNMPDDAADANNLDSIGGRAPQRRIQGDEGRKVRLTQYARAVDHALRPVLNAESLPLIVAAAEPMLSIFRNLSGYTRLAPYSIEGNPDTLNEAELADAARGVLDQLYGEELDELKDTLSQRGENGRSATDLSDLARAAAFGAINTLLVDMDAKVPGTVTDDGALELGEGNGDALEEIARRAIATGARILAVRSSDLPDGVQAAAILRYAI